MGRGGSDSCLPSRQSIYKVTRALKREQNSLFNCLNSILTDASFVNELISLYEGTPLLANLRCGLWYTPNPDATCYFKSTDGHAGAWKFSKVRLNWHVAELAAGHGSCMIVDATRKGKRFPDSLSKTLPIWAAIINRAVARVRASHPPPSPPLSPTPPALASFDEPDLFVDDTQSIIPDVGPPEPWIPTPEACSSPRLNSSAATVPDMPKPFCSLMSLKEWLFEELECGVDGLHPRPPSATPGAGPNRAALSSPRRINPSDSPSSCTMPSEGPTADPEMDTRSPAVPLSSSPFATMQLDLSSEDGLPGIVTPRLSTPGTSPPQGTAASTPASFAFLASSPPSPAAPTPDLTQEEVAEEPAEPEWDTALHLPLWVPHNERQQIEAMLDAWVDELMEMGVDVEGLSQALKKPLRPLWLSPTSLIWVDKVCPPADMPFTPLYLVSASMPHEHRRDLPKQSVTAETCDDAGSEGTFSYVPGAGDDEESWACGLTPGLFWRHYQELLQAGPSGVKSAVKRLVAAAPQSERAGIPRPLPPASNPDITELHNLKPQGCEGVQGVNQNKTESGIYWIGNTGIGIGNFAAGAPPTVWGLASSVLNCGMQQHPTFVDMVTCMSCKLGSDALSPAAAAAVPTLRTSSSCSLSYNPYSACASTGYSSSPPINIRCPSTWHLGHRSHRLAACLSSGALVDDLTDHVFDSPGSVDSSGSLSRNESSELPSGEDGIDPLWDIDAVEVHAPHAMHVRQYSSPCQRYGSGALGGGGSGSGSGSGSPNCLPGGDLWSGANSFPDQGARGGRSRLRRCHSAMGSSFDDTRSVDFANELFSSRVSGTSNSSGSCMSGGSGGGSVCGGYKWNKRPGPPSCATCRQVAYTMSSDRYLWLPILSSKNGRTDLADHLDDALAFIGRALVAGRKVLIHDDDGLDTAVCVAVATLLAFFDAPDPTDYSQFTRAKVAQWQPPHLRIPNLCVSTEEITKQVVRRRLAVVSAFYPPARPTRGMLKQVYSFFHPQHKPESQSP